MVMVKARGRVRVRVGVRVGVRVRVMAWNKILGLSKQWLAQNEQRVCRAPKVNISYILINFQPTAPGRAKS